MNWPVMNIPVQQALVQQYIERSTSIVHNLYEFHPDEDWEQRVQWLQDADHLRADRASLVETLRNYNKVYNDHPRVMQSLDRLANEEAVVVVGGQQGGLFTGPLLVVHKAISIIRMAQEAEEKLGRPVIPVFWIAGEDHDYDEVNHAYLLSAEPALQRVRLEKPTELRAPVSRIKLTESDWEQVLTAAEEWLPATEFKPDLMERMRQTARRSTSLTDAFAHMLSDWFGPYGLVLLDSDDPALRRLEKPMFQSLIQGNECLEQALLASEQDIAAQGFAIQAERGRNSANLFVVHEGERRLLYKEGDLFQDRSGTVSWDKEQLLLHLDQHPEQFSNNVLTRPLMQEYLFPVLATVLGPGELAYWAQTKRAFHAFRMRMPMLWSRMSFTCMEGTLNKLLTKYELTAEDICSRYAEKRAEWLTAQDELRLDERFAAMKANVDAQYGELLDALSTTLPSLGKLGDTNRAKVLEQIDFLRNRAHDALHKQHESGLRQWERLKLALWPLDKPQERVLNPLMYECRYGKDWFKPLMEAPVVWQGEHRLVLL
ncbi:bacillithiol biosynthesis cysteine-adding enzyme BshC [Paenibacillus sp. 481]|uniref:bacillithiol biosynthesis cysteine-adding enzyme BshC n=1 Tax=Paenibacillus sp. 481 TaxID=2835869 RepID=UPI001E30FD0F|nr:bacillithiol biosynthesis cysteine-adding enzyme BshC [Paenibacillus sp. 481]UHA74135.1 bacillithiol biosynthesis cysteine-adding enzyme BshC [Paenibacillus sp. 481]